MDFYLRKNGTVAGPMSQADFLARLANGEYAATDEMSTDGRVWTRLGITGFARSIQQGRFVASARLGSVVPDLTQTGQAAPPPPAPTPTPAPAPVPVAPCRRSPLVPVFAVLLVAALGALAWILASPKAKEGLAPEPAQRIEAVDSGAGGAGEPVPVPAPAAHGRHALLVSLGSYNAAAYASKGRKAPGSRGGSAKADLRNIETACRSLGDWTDVKTLFDGEATLAEIRRQMAAFADRLQPGEEFLFFFSSHGGVYGDATEKSGDAFLCANDDLYDEEELLEDLLAFRKGVRPLVILSACHSAAMFEKSLRVGGDAAPIDTRAFLRRMTAPRGLSAVAGDHVSAADIGWICSAASDQSSWRTRNDSGSVFASYAIAREGWMGGAADGLATAVVKVNGESAIQSADEFAKVDTIFRQEPTGRVSFLDLALYAVRKCKDVVNDREKSFSIPQFANPHALMAVIAGRTGGLDALDSEDEDVAPLAMGEAGRAGLRERAVAALSSARPAAAPESSPSHRRNGPDSPFSAEWAFQRATSGSGADAESFAAPVTFREALSGGVAPPPAPQAELSLTSYLAPSGKEVVELFNHVRSSPAVTENDRYSRTALGINCRVVENDELNAYAHWTRLESGAVIREICYHSGHARFDRVVGAIASKMFDDSGAVLTEEQQKKVVRTLVVDIPRTLRTRRYRISDDTARELLKTAGIGDADLSNPAFLANARAVADGIALSTLSHEMGHHVLGHLDTSGETSTNLVFSRAQEEQADLFATQVMAAAPTDDTRRQIFIGRFLWCLLVASTERGGSDEKRTHPATRRRLRNLVESDPSTAREFGLDTDSIEQILKVMEALQGQSDDVVAAEPVAEEGGTGPRRFALLVGVGHFDAKAWGGDAPLDAPAQNVRMVQSLLAGCGGFRREDIRLLEEEDASYEAVRAAVQKAAVEARPGDMFVFYFSGHGGQWGDRNQTFLVTYDPGPSEGRGARVGYSDDELNEDFSLFSGGVSVAAVLQACHSGGVMSMRGGVQPKAPWNPADFASSVSRLRADGKGARAQEVAPIGWITAADADHSSWGGFLGSSFTIAFIEGIRTGECDANGDRLASFAEAWRYASAELAKDPKYNSFPQCSDETLCDKIAVPIPQ